MGAREAVSLGVALGGATSLGVPAGVGQVSLEGAGLALCESRVLHSTPPIKIGQARIVQETGSSRWGSLHSDPPLVTA